MTGYVVHDQDGRPIRLCGVAVPYRQNAIIDEEKFSLEYGAFEKQAVKGFPNISLQWSHSPGAAPLASTNDFLTIYDHPFGLLFESHFTAGPATMSVLAVAQSAGLGVSIRFFDDVKRADGRVTGATLDHIALAPAGETCFETVAWLEDSSGAHGPVRLDPEITEWRAHLNREIRRLDMLEREAEKEARAQKSNVAARRPARKISVGDELAHAMKRSRARVRAPAR